MRDKKFRDRETVLLYLFARILPALAVSASFVAVGLGAWAPAAQVAEGMPYLAPALFACYAIALVAGFLLFSGAFRFSFWYPLAAAAAIAAAVALRFFPASGPTAEFSRFSRDFIALASVSAFIFAMGLGALLARFKAAVIADVAVAAALGVLVVVALDGDPDRLAVPRIVLILLWHILHSLSVEHAISILPAERKERKRFVLSYAAKYALLMLVCGLLYYSTVGLATCASAILDSAGGAASPYENKGQPRDKENKAVDDQLRKLKGAGNYVHSLKPVVKLDDAYNPGEKTLLYNVYVKSFDGQGVEGYFGGEYKEKFQPLYLGRFVLSSYDPAAQTFTIDPQDPTKASFFGQPLPFDRVKLSPNAVVPLGGPGEDEPLRRRMSLTVSLTPFIDGDEAISPDYPVALSVLMRKSASEARKALADNIARFGDSALDAERVYVAAYALEARVIANDLDGISAGLARDMAEKFPKRALSREERDYYTFTGGNEDALKARALALSLTAGLDAQADQARLIKDFFTVQGDDRPAAWGKPFTYDLKPGVAVNGGSKLQAFLFDHRRGYCQYYALASALMLRSIGIPSRVVAGYLGIDRSTRNQGYYYIYSNQAHAWTEVFLDGIGWVQLDATPAAPPSLSGLLGPPGPDGTPPEFPDPPERSVLAFTGKVVSVSGQSVALMPETYQIGTPVDFSGLDKALRDKIPRIYVDSFSAGPAIPFPAAGMIVQLDRDMIFYSSEKLSSGKAGLSLDFGVGPKKAAERLGALARADASGEATTRVTLVGTFSAAEAMKGRLAMDELSPSYELVGVFPKGYVSQAEAKAASSRLYWAWAFIALAGLAAAAFAFPFVLCQALRSAMFLAIGQKSRALALLEYMRYRLHILGEGSYGMTLEEWGVWLKETHGLDASKPLGAVERARYDPGYSGGLDARSLRSLRSEFESSLHEAFPMERNFIAFFDPVKAVEYLRERGASLFRRLRGTKR
jgi:hypothetical protein